MKYANHFGYSDVTPYEVVKVISNKTLEVRKMKYELDSDWKPEFIIGGFAGHCVNQWQQKWNITSDESNKVIRIRLGKKGWKSACGFRFELSETPKRFYDYNF